MSPRQPLCDDSLSSLNTETDSETHHQKPAAKYLAQFGDCEEPKMGWERYEDGQIACHHRKLLFSTAVQCRNYLYKSGCNQGLASVLEEEGAECLAKLDEECAEERSRLRNVKRSLAKQKNAILQEMKVRAAQLQKANRQLGHEMTVTERQLAQLQQQHKRELRAVKALHQQKLESITSLLELCNGLPPLIATFRDRPAHRRLVVVVALGPYGFPSDEEGRDAAVRFVEFAAVNEADLLFLSMANRIPGLKLQAAQLVKTQIEQHIFKSHGAAHDWERICILDETFPFPDGSFNVFDAVPEGSLLVGQPHLSEAVNGLKYKALPSIIVMSTQHTLVLERGRQMLVKHIITHNTRGYDAAQAFVSSMTAACAGLGIPVHSMSQCPFFSSKNCECPTEDGSESGSEGLLTSDESVASEGLRQSCI
jgi:hypothetical protein